MEDELIKHTKEIIDIISNDCTILLDEKTYNQDNEAEMFSILRKGISHIQGLCNGLKLRFKEE